MRRPLIRTTRTCPPSRHSDLHPALRARQVRIPRRDVGGQGRAAEELLPGSGTVFKHVDAYDRPMPMGKESLLPGLPTGQEETHAQVTAGARRLTSRRVGAVSMLWMPGSRLMRWSM